MMKMHQVTADVKTPPIAGGTYTEAHLTIPRAKPRSVFNSLLYRSVKLGRCVFGDLFLLRFCLNAAWLLRRCAFEISGHVFGPTFHCSALALSEDVLARWIPAGGSVIDIGCGRGRWCRVAARYAGSVLGVDSHAPSIKYACSATQADNIEYRVGDAVTETKGRQFDVALLVHVLEHIDDVDSLLTAIYGTASTLVVEVPDFDADPLNRIRRELGCPYYWDADHVREYTSFILRQQLDRNGWNIRYQEQRGGCILVVAARAN